MFLTKLDIVNSCLRTMGEVKLNTLEEDHSYKASALDLVDQVLRDVLSLGLWFNTEWLKLQPQADTKFVMIPADVLKLSAMTRCGRWRVAQRGRRLYDTSSNSYEFTSEVQVRAVRLLPFEDIPYEAQMFIRDDTVLRFQSDFDGDNGKYQKLLQHRHESYINLKSEHIRQIKANPLFGRASLDVLRDRMYNYSGRPWHPHTTFPG